MNDGSQTALRQCREKQVGFQGAPADPMAILLKNNDLHVEIQIDPAEPHRSQPMLPRSRTC